MLNVKIGGAAYICACKKNIFRIFPKIHTADKSVNSTEVIFVIKQPKRDSPEVDQNKSAGVVGRNQLTESTQLKADYTLNQAAVY